MRDSGWKVLDSTGCRFAYRDSLFKSIQPGRFFITSIRLVLQKRFHANLAYSGLTETLRAAGVDKPGLADVYRAVIHLRRSKLPDPAIEGNAGSFFKNPVLGGTQLEQLRTLYPDLPCWPVDESAGKVSAAWLIEQSGLKGHEIAGAAVSDQHSLVLVNRGGASGAAVWELARHVQQAVLDRFGVRLEPEPAIYRQPVIT